MSNEKIGPRDDPRQASPRPRAPDWPEPCGDSRTVGARRFLRACYAARVPVRIFVGAGVEICRATPQLERWKHRAHRALLALADQTLAQDDVDPVSLFIDGPRRCEFRDPDGEVFAQFEIVAPSLCRAARLLAAHLRSGSGLHLVRREANGLAGLLETFAARDEQPVRRAAR